MVSLPLPQVTFPSLSFVYLFGYFFLSFLFFPRDPDSVLPRLSLPLFHPLPCPGPEQSHHLASGP